MNRLRVIFMGTPEFAVASLEVLAANGVNVVAVVTAPDKPQGRGQRLLPSPVKECALKLNIPVLQPTNLKDPGFVAELKTFQADLQVVVAFRMLPEVVWSMPRLGTFNLHASLLPNYRGAAPINWAIINGEKETGVTTFLLRQEIDTGKVLFQEKELIRDDDDAGSLYNRLMKKGAGLVIQTVRAIEAGNYTAIEQVATGDLRPAPKIFKDMCRINWDQPAHVIHNFVRGLSPYPAAWMVMDDQTYKVYRTSLPSDQHAGNAGDHRTDNKAYLYFKTRDGWISIDELQPEGKKRMKIDEFLRGKKL